jgi:hypothetical protein
MNTANSRVDQTDAGIRILFFISERPIVKKKLSPGKAIDGFDG